MLLEDANFVLTDVIIVQIQRIANLVMMDIFILIIYALNSVLQLCPIIMEQLVSIVALVEHI